MREFNRRFYDKRISMSLPSLRVATVSSGILKEIRAVRKTGFTIAPEAGTARLRAVINKDITDDIYVTALETLFKAGWNNLKLYFMTGLPTETDDDIAAIPEMVLQAIKISRRLTGRHVNISVGVSSFVPKPHTPFQWFGQNDLETLKKKNSYLKKEFLRRGVKYKGHDEEMSLLEAALSRGDRSISALIESAWKSGCRLDAWTDAFDFNKWKSAMEVSGIDASDYAVREYNRDSVFPWGNIDTGVSGDYLRKEYDNALSGKFTPDCRRHCHNCGLKCKTDSKGKAQEENAIQLETPSVHQPSIDDVKYLSVTPKEDFIRVRLRYSKTGSARYLSHLEMTTAIIRAMRRAGFRLRYSGGFHPFPKVSFGPALKVGIAGLKEYLDAEFLRPFDTEKGLLDLNNTLPSGLNAEKMDILSGKEKSLNSFIIRYVYEVRRGDNCGLAMRKDNLANMAEMTEDIMELANGVFRLTVVDREEKKVRLDELISAIFGLSLEDVEVTRTIMFGWEGDWVEPMEGKERWAVKS